jgi:thymidylate kinase
MSHHTGSLITFEGLPLPKKAKVYSMIQQKIGAKPQIWKEVLKCLEPDFIDLDSVSIRTVFNRMLGMFWEKQDQIELNPVALILQTYSILAQKEQSDILPRLRSGISVFINYSSETASKRWNLPYNPALERFSSDLERAIAKCFNDRKMFTPDYSFYLRVTPEFAADSFMKSFVNLSATKKNMESLRETIALLDAKMEEREERGECAILDGEESAEELAENVAHLLRAKLLRSYRKM